MASSKDNNDRVPLISSIRSRFSKRPKSAEAPQDANTAEQPQTNEAETDCKCKSMLITKISRLHRDMSTNSGTFTIDEEEFPYLTTYRPLRRNPREIRLLTWIKGDDEDIRLSLEVHDLDRDPKYTALSYTWGSNKDLRNVLVDGQPVKIRSTLFEFLQSLPADVRKLPFWLDVLCINQRDLDERNTQVRSMSTIYRQAAAVYSWLGPGTASTASADEFLRQTRAHRVAQQYKDARYENNEDLVQHTIEAAMIDWHSKSEDWCNGLKEIFGREYWSRIWILQETILAKQLYCLVGQHIFLFEDIRAAQRAIRDSSQSFYHRPVALAKQAILSIHLGRRKIRSEMSMWRSDLHMFIRKGGCRDPRDHVFALHGVFSHEEALMPDYSKSTIEVWWQASSQLLARNFFDSLKLWEAMRPVNFLGPLAPKLIQGAVSYDIYPWYCFYDTTGPLLGSVRMPRVEHPDKFRGICDHHPVVVAHPKDATRLTREHIVLRYFRNIPPDQSDIFLLCLRPGYELWCAILRPMEGKQARFVGIGIEPWKWTENRYYPNISQSRLEIDSDLEAAAEMTLQLREDWNSKEGDAAKAIPGRVELNGAATVLLHQIRSLFD